MNEFLSVQTLILVLVTFLVTNGIKSLSELLKMDLTGYAAAWTAAIVAMAFGVFQSVILPQIPTEYLPIVEQVAAVLLTLLGAMGVHKTIKQYKSI